MSEEIWLQWETPNGFKASAFTGVPAASPSWIILVSSGSDKGLAHVDALCKELESVLLASAPGATSRSISPPGPLEALNPAQFPNRCKLLVLVASVDKKLDGLDWYKKWQDDSHFSSVMTVMPKGDFAGFFTAAVNGDPEHLLRRINANRWEKEISEAAPGILARANITGAVPRIFISYRRVETGPLANQFFDALTQAGFEVFLDRFSIPVGLDFQRRLFQELEDKSMVLLMESEHLSDSKWTQHEIDFAKRYRLGLLALRMPGTKPLMSISFGQFEQLDEQTDFVAPHRIVTDPEGRQVKEWQPLTGAALEKMVARIKSAHTQVLFERRHRLRVDIVAELKKQNVAVNYIAVGPLHARVGAEEHLIWPTVRPPEVEDFQLTHATHGARTGVSPRSRGIVVGPQVAQEPDRKARLEWLEKVSACPNFDEAKLGELALRIARGTL